MPAAARSKAPDSIDEALFVDTTCEETPFPWQRTAAPPTRLAEALASLHALPSGDFYPFDATTALSDSLVLRLRRAGRTPRRRRPRQAALPDVPTLILSGAQDLRTPTSNARSVAALIPDAQLLVVPFTGHSVLGSDFSGCAERAVQAFFAGAWRHQCSRARPPPTCSRPRRSPRRGSPTCHPPRARRQARADADGRARHDPRPQPPGDRRDAAGRRSNCRAARASAACAAATRDSTPQRWCCTTSRSCRACSSAGRSRSGTASCRRPRSAISRLDGRAGHGQDRLRPRVVSGTLGGRRFDVSIAQRQARRAPAPVAANGRRAVAFPLPGLAAYADAGDRFRLAPGRSSPSTRLR